MKQRTSLAKPKGFSLWRTVYSHGWCALPPFSIDKENHTFHRLLILEDGTPVNSAIREDLTRLRIDLESRVRLTPAQQREVRIQLRACFRMDEQFTDFYSEARKNKQFRWIVKARAGRMLRAPTVFEDVVKMICTTNCSWSLTESMVRNLTTQLGEPARDDIFSFPTPQKIAGVTESYLRKNIRAGYRSPYLLELAEKVAGRKLDIESWRHSPLTTGELFKEVRSVKGIGDYAAGNLLKLLGRYDYLGLDSWVRGKYGEIYRHGRRVSDRTIERHYAPFGKWRGLFFWLDMTRDWYNEKFPF